MKNLSESDLVGLIRGGDERAFSELVSRHREAVVRVIGSMLGNVPEADDIGQEVFVRFWRSVENYRHEAEVRTYLTRIAINLSINELNRRKRKLSYLLPLALSQKESEQVNLESHEKAYSDSEIVAAALQRLDPVHRSVIVLRLVEGYSTKETADILGVPLGTVLSRLARAQEKLRRIIEKLSIS